MQADTTLPVEQRRNYKVRGRVRGSLGQEWRRGCGQGRVGSVWRPRRRPPDSLLLALAHSSPPPPSSASTQGVFDALARIVKDEGVAGLFTGAGPTVVRACALNMGMLASNDQVRWGSETVWDGYA